MRSPFLCSVLVFSAVPLSSLHAEKSPPAVTPAPLGISAAASEVTPTASATPQGTSSPTPLTATNKPVLIVRELPEIHAKIALPREWTLLPGKLLEGDVLLATREKIANENDPWSTGLSMTLDRNGPTDSGQKASDYALALAREAREKAGDEATPLKESHSGSVHEIRFDFPMASEPPLEVTEVLRADNEAGTLAVIIWQMPKEESASLQGLRDSILSGLILKPAQ